MQQFYNYKEAVLIAAMTASISRAELPVYLVGSGNSPLSKIVLLGDGYLNAGV
jgi:hypothetical protein